MGLFFSGFKSCRDSFKALFDKANPVHYSIKHIIYMYRLYDVDFNDKSSRFTDHVDLNIQIK